MEKPFFHRQFALCTILPILGMDIERGHGMTIVNAIAKGGGVPGRWSSVEVVAGIVDQAGETLNH